jgi:hypothetical protein
MPRRGSDIHSCSLLNQINGAPQELKSLQAELDFCSQVLDEIKHNEQVFGPHPTTKLALERCVEPIGALNSMADSFAPGLMSESKVKQKWTALEAVRKGDQIAKIKAKLQEAKINLLMAQQSAAMFGPPTIIVRGKTLTIEIDGRVIIFIGLIRSLSLD